MPGLDPGIHFCERNILFYIHFNRHINVQMDPRVEPEGDNSGSHNGLYAEEPALAGVSKHGEAPLHSP
jgi:hypothetical protein